MKNPSALHKRFTQLGKQRHKLLHQLLAILPEIYESRIYKKYASSIFEYASKFGGIPRSSVEKRLRLEKHLENRPILKEAIEDVGVNKVAMVATPADYAQEVTDQLVEAGIKAILNYAPIQITVPANVRVEYIDPATHLQKMSYYLK